MAISLETRAAGLALLAAAVSLGGTFAMATPIKWLMNSSAPESQAAAAFDPALAAQGRQLFVMSCVECHGDDAHGDEGPDLDHLAISNARIAATIKKGVKGQMPNFTKKYDDAQVSALVAYLRSLP